MKKEGSFGIRHSVCFFVAKITRTERAQSDEGVASLREGFLLVA